jgi:HPt (histidine-containing phosphotransfer) domain-containing protein
MNTHQQPLPDSAPIDLAAALKRTMGDVDFLRLMLDTFAATLPEQLSVITTALDAHSAEALAGAAHKLKGTALNLSIGHLAKSAREVEQIGREGRLDEGQVALARLKKDCAEFEAQLAAVDWAALSPSD